MYTIKHTNTYVLDIIKKKTNFSLVLCCRRLKRKWPRDLLNT